MKRWISTKEATSLVKKMKEALIITALWLANIAFAVFILIAIGIATSSIAEGYNRLTRTVSIENASFAMGAIVAVLIVIAVSLRQRRFA